MHRTLPPFRADHVGSLLRSPKLKAAREQRAAGAISAGELAEVEDAEIRTIIAKQKALGLQAATDGEFRRSWWHFDFLWGLEGVERFDTGQGIAFAGVTTKAEGARVHAKVGFAGHPMIDHFRFLKASTDLVPKMTIPSPSVLHFRGGRKTVPEAVYPDLEAFYRDLGAAYNSAVMAFAEAGCRYLQLDETNLAYLCDPAQREMVRARGEDPDALPATYARLINAAIAGRPADMAITMHLCRGNFRSSWISQGGYEPVAEILFNEIGVDGYFMEYDSERAGGFEPLRFVPKGKTVVLGLVTSKTGTLESKDELKRRIEAASRVLDLDQLCLSPQCGFASTEEGNLLAHDEQWAKLERIVEVADEVWG
jgi:5-methyltetrahydropteroyltriglutamate--homocysteine methyltransferase